jgi:hypothetical protein
MVVNGRPRGKVVGQKSPRTAAFEDIEDGVEDIAQGVGAWSSLGLWGRQVRSQTNPLGVGKVGGIRLSHRRKRTKSSQPLPLPNRLSEDPFEEHNIVDERDEEEIEERRNDVVAWRARVNAVYEGKIVAN